MRILLPISNHDVCILLTETDSVYLAYFLKETQGLAVLDSGCSKTVCGQSWLRPYGETLSVHDRQLVSETQCSINSVLVMVLHIPLCIVLHFPIISMEKGIFSHLTLL